MDSFQLFDGSRHKLFLLFLVMLFIKTKAESVYDLEYRGVACEGMWGVFTCPQDYYIKVMAATYGRSDNTTCTSNIPEGKLTEVMCDVNGTVAMLQKKCDGFQNCDIHVTADTFNDTQCGSVHNYLDILYVCEAGLFTALACEGYKLNLGCPNDEVLHINSLEYGRTDNDTCHHESILETGCTTTEPFDHVSDLCNGKTNCSLYIYNNLLGDPCPGTYKYLLLDHLCGDCVNIHNDADCDYYAEIGECEKNVNWMSVNCRRSCWNCKHTDKCLDKGSNCPYWASIGECHVNPGWMTQYCRKSCNLCYLLVESKPDRQSSVSHSLCEGMYLNMTCPSVGYSLRIEDVRFGRWDNSTCVNPSINDTEFDCDTPEGTLETVQRVCDGQENCWYEARVNLFGDNCPGLYKQSEVTYSCQKCEDSYEESECEALKTAGRCDTDYDWMMDYCFKTCSHCQYRDCGNSADVGKDVPDCDYWAMLGYCDTNRDDVHTKCASSCQTCAEPEATTTPVPVPDGPISVEICEAQSEKLQCPTDLHLQIDYVFFGRIDNETCPHSKGENINCTTRELSEDIVRMLCDGRSECYFEANSVILGDPCPGTYKVGRVIYTCKECVNNISDAECEEILTSGQCTSDYVHAMRKCYKTCSQCQNRVCGNPHENDLDCDFYAARGDCETKPRHMHIDCKESCGRCAFPNPEQLEPVENKICEVQASYLSCPIGYKLYINSMFFGREDNETCHHDSVTHFNCSTPEGALRKLQKLCNGREKCWFEARSELFGDNCPDTYKAAAVNYTCQVCANTASAAFCRVGQTKGRCEENYDTMTQSCYKTCTQCETSTCETVHSSLTDCDYWAARGECESAPEWMLKNCKESCHSCVEPETTTAPPPTTTPHPDQLDPVTEDICEWQVKEMACPTYYFLHVHSIFYGRIDPDICPHDNILNTDCLTPEGALENAQRVCDGMPTCWFEARSDVWGDNCPDTFKTGSVQYSCQLCKNLADDASCEQWAAEGKCETDYNSMMNQCFKTCTSCDEPLCDNAHVSSASCDSWAIAGECTANPTFMLTQCAASCGVCADVMNTTPLITSTYPHSCEGRVWCEHGYCIEEEDRCMCDLGWGGESCQVFHCDNVKNCSGHGRCYGPNQCACEPYYSETDCSSCSVTYQVGSACLPCPFCQQGRCVEDPSETFQSSYVGCFSDDEASREYSNVTFLSDGSTASPALCINMCAMMGFKYAALQGTNKCQCGNSYGQHGVSTSCSSLCTDSEQICGGNLAHSVYRTWQGKCECLSGWEGDFCSQCMDSDCQASTTTPQPLTSPFTLNVVLQIEWEDIYSDLSNPETAVFVQSLTADLFQFYKDIEPRTSRVQIVQLRKGSVEVEHLVWFSEPVSNDEQDDMECAVYEKLSGQGSIGQNQAKSGDRMAENCAWREDHCQNGGELYRENNVWHCRCPANTRGSQCETSKMELGILIGIIVACCVAFLIILIIVICCLHRRKKQKGPQTTAILSAASSANISTADSLANLKDQMELSYQYPDITDTGARNDHKRASNGINNPGET